MALSLYFDEDSGEKELLMALRARGVDCISAGDVGMLGRSDLDHLEFAANNLRVLVTANQGDFARIHNQWMRAGRSHAGILVISQQRYDIGVRLERMLRFVEVTSESEMPYRIAFLSDYGG